MAKGTVNKVIILGRLGQDPDVKATASGTQVVNLNIATNELGPKNEMGQRSDITEWHRVIVFGRTAEIAAQYLKKGSLVYIEGRLQTKKWQDKNGNDRWTTEILGNELQLMGSKDDQASQHQNNTQQQYNNQQQPQGNAQQTSAAGNQSNPYDDFDDDIPF